jgi:hypothetical protein
MEGPLGGPRLAVTRWPGPVLDEGWRARVGLRGGRLQAAWGAFLGRMPWEAFVTLTFDPKRRFPVSRELASRETFRWCSDAARLLRRPIAWAYATERHASGLWHAHILVAGAGGASWDVPRAMWQARNGHADVRRVDSPLLAALYTTKSAALEGEVVLSDTLLRYKDLLRPSITAGLHPQEPISKV